MTLGQDEDIIAIDMTHHGTEMGIHPLVTHGPSRCTTQRCTIHNPSDHHAKDWPQVWDLTMRRMDRRCPHGVLHPDPDELAIRSRHTCDGCCPTGETVSING